VFGLPLAPLHGLSPKAIRTCGLMPDLLKTQRRKNDVKAARIPCKEYVTFVAQLTKTAECKALRRDFLQSAL
jgi:hypothetical protein